MPARVDEASYPEPRDEVLDNSFDLSNFTGACAVTRCSPGCRLVRATHTHLAAGRWNITAGQNALFDTFDCQVHDFDMPEPNGLRGQLRWRVQKSNGDFISRHAALPHRSET